MRRALLLGVTALALIAAGPPQASFNDIENEVMCTSCGVPLSIAESPQAERERAEIRRLVAQGLTKSQVKARLVADYGPNVLALPKSEGFNVAVYVLPIVLFATLVGGVGVLLPRWRRQRATSGGDGEGAGAPPLGAADAQRLDEDLARYDV
jgi:cytochrome c-type biogenesis protein CcmH